MICWLGPGVIVFVIAVASAAPVSQAGATRDPLEQTAVRRARTKAEARIDSQLLAAIDRDTRGDAPRATDRAVFEVDANGRVLLDIRADVTDALVEAVKEIGGAVVSRFPQYDSLRAHIPWLKILSLAERDDIKFIRAAERPVTNAPAVPRKPDEPLRR